MKHKTRRNAVPFDIPSGITGGFYIELYNDNEAVLTGDCEIIDLDSSVLKIKCNEHTVSFCGNDIEIISYSSTGIRIGGKITSVEFG